MSGAEEDVEEDEDPEDSSADSDGFEGCPSATATTDQHSSVKQDFNIALIFAEADEALANRIKRHVNGLVLSDGRKVRMIDCNDPSFGGSVPTFPRKFTSSCELTFVLLTENTLLCTEQCEFMIREAIGETDLGGNQKQQSACVWKIHTQSHVNRSYSIPPGLTGVRSVEWYESDDGCQENIEVSLNGFIKRSDSAHKRTALEHQCSVSPELEKIINRGNVLRRSKQAVLFYQTLSGTQAMKTVIRNGCVFLVGRSGDGKTATAYHILEDLISQDESLIAFIVQKPEDLDWIDISDKKKYVVLVDDIFGVSSFSLVLFQKWKDYYFPMLKTLVKEHVVYFIATSLSHTVSKTHVSDISLLQRNIDTSLRSYEKRPMLMDYLEKYGVKMSDKDIADVLKSGPSIGFPQCCMYFVTNADAKSIGPKFFQNPLEFLQKKISELKDNDSLAYLVLIMAIFEKGRLSFESLNPFKSPPVYLKDLKQGCGVHKQATLGEIRQAAEKVCKIGYLVEKEKESEDEKDMYIFPHQSIYDAVCFVFGKLFDKKMIEICPLDFLVDHTALQRQNKTPNVFPIKANAKKCFINRLSSEIEQGSYRIFEHTAFSENKFVEDVMKDQIFNDSLTEMFNKEETANKLTKSRMLYFLTTARAGSPFLLQLVDIICKSPERAKERLLHDILEGACSSGDVELFEKLMCEDAKPCENCFLLAAESQTDQPVIMKVLPKETFAENQRRILKRLVNKGSIETVKSVSEFINWRPFHIQRRRKKLFDIVCLKGNYNMFRLLQRFIKLPDCTEELLVSGIIGKNKKIVELLITEENKNCRDNFGRTLLHHACDKAPNLCKFLVDKGVELNCLDDQGATPFHMACKIVDEKMMKKLLELGFLVTVTDIPERQNYGPLKLSPLHMAAKNEQGWSLVDTLIKKGPHNYGMVNFQDRDGSTPLHIACRMPYGEKMIRILSKKGADPFLKDKYGKMPLHIAAEANIPKNIECLLALADYGDVNITDNTGQTPLHLVITRPYLKREEEEPLADSISHFIQKKADINVPDRNGNTVLHTAALHNLPYRIFEILIPKQRKKLKLKKNNKNESPLHVLLSPNCPADTTGLLLEKYENLETAGDKSVLHVALDKQAPFHIIKMLLEKRTFAKKVDWQRIRFTTAFKQFTADQIIQFLQQCARHFPPEVKQELTQLLCSREMTDDKWTTGMNLLLRGDVSLPDLPLIQGVADSLQKVNYLLDRGTSVKAKDANGTPPLHAVIESGNMNGVKMLLEKGTDVSAVNRHMETALLKTVKLAVSEPFKEIIKCFSRLMKEGFFYSNLGLSLSLQSCFYTKQRVAIGPATLSLLLKTDVPLNVTDSHGFAAIHYATQDLEILKQLVSAGADLSLISSTGLSCLHIACMKKNNSSVIKYLLDSGLSPSVKDENNITPLHFAIYCQIPDTSLLKRLYQPWLQISFEIPFLHLAASYSTKEVVRMFVKLNPDLLFIEDKEGYLPIHCAIAGGDLKILIVVTEAMKAAKRNWTILTDNEHTRSNKVSAEYVVQLGDSKDQSMKGMDQFTSTEDHATAIQDPSTGNEIDSVGRGNHNTETGDQVTRPGNHSTARIKNQETEWRDQTRRTKDQATRKKNQSAGSGQHNTVTDDASISSAEDEDLTKKEDQLTGQVVLLSDTGNQNLDTDTHHAECGGHQTTFCASNQSLQQLMRLWEDMNGHRLLCFASKYNQTNILEFLLREGYEVKQCDKADHSPLHYAVMEENRLEIRIDNDQSGYISLHVSPESGRYETVEHLIKSGAPVETFNNFGYTPLHMACSGAFPRVKIIKLLLANGASASTCSRVEGRNALHFICAEEFLTLILNQKNSGKRKWKPDSQAFDLAKLPKTLIESGCPVNTKDAGGQTPLHLAVNSGNSVYVNLLLDQNAEVDAVDKEGRTPLHLALQKGSGFLSLSVSSAALRLVERGAKLHATVRCGETPLDLLMKMQRNKHVSKETQQICELFDIWQERESRPHANKQTCIKRNTPNM